MHVRGRGDDVHVRGRYDTTIHVVRDYAFSCNLCACVCACVRACVSVHVSVCVCVE